jgi:LysM repeat protein
MDRVKKSMSRGLTTSPTLLAAVLLITCLLLAGCSVDPFGSKKEVQEVRTSTNEDIRTTRGDIQRLQEEIENLSVRFERFSSAQEREIQAVRRAVSGLEGQIAQGNNSVLAEVERKVAEVDAKRAADREQLTSKVNDVVNRINTLSQRINTVLSSRPRESGAVTERGIEYEVQDGDSLWGIASKFKEHGVTVDAIRRANNMDPSDSRIVPGQKLFIPVKE